MTPAEWIYLPWVLTSSCRPHDTSRVNLSTLSANKLLLISAPSMRVCRSALDVSAPRSLPAHSIISAHLLHSFIIDLHISLQNLGQQVYQKKSAGCEWFEAASDWYVSWSRTERYWRWHWSVALTSPCLCLSHKSTFWIFTVIKVSQTLLTVQKEQKERLTHI